MRAQEDLREMAAARRRSPRRGVDPRGLRADGRRRDARRGGAHQIATSSTAARSGPSPAPSRHRQTPRAVDDRYLRERSHDVEFVGDRLLRALGAAAPTTGLPKLDGPLDRSSPTISRPPTPRRWSTSRWSASSPRWARAPATPRSWRARWRSPRRRRERRALARLHRRSVIVDGLRGASSSAPPRPTSPRRAAAPPATSRSPGPARSRATARPTTKDGVPSCSCAPTSSSPPRRSSRAIRAPRASASTAPSSSTSIAPRRRPRTSSTRSSRRVVETMRPEAR